MQLLTVLYYSYIYDVIFITIFKIKQIIYILRVLPPFPMKNSGCPRWLHVRQTGHEVRIKAKALRGGQNVAFSCNKIMIISTNLSG